MLSFQVKAYRLFGLVSPNRPINPQQLPRKLAHFPNGLIDPLRQRFRIVIGRAYNDSGVLSRSRLVETQKVQPIEGQHRSASPLANSTTCSSGIR